MYREKHEPRWRHQRGSAGPETIHHGKSVLHRYSHSDPLQPATAARERESSASRLVQTRFVLRLQAQPGVEPYRALRGLLKVALRRFGLKALDVRPSGPPPAKEARLQ